MPTQHHHRHHRHHYQSSELTESEDASVRLRAYEIHREKGGGALDNWLEAEQALKSRRTA